MNLIVALFMLLTLASAVSVNADTQETSDERVNLDLYANGSTPIEPEGTQCEYFCSWCTATDYGCDAYGYCC